MTHQKELFTSCLIRFYRLLWDTVLLFKDLFMPENKNQESKSGSKSSIFLIIIIALLGVIGYLLYNNIVNADKIEQQEGQITELGDTIQAKLADLEELQTAFESLKLQNEELGQNNDSINAKIAELQEYIKQVKAGNASKIKGLNQMIAKLNLDLQAKEQEIITLRKERDSLVVAVDTLKQEKVVMNDSINALRSNRTELQQKVAIASILKAENLKIVAVNDKGKVFDKEELKSKNIDKLKVDFTLADNKVARKDKKQMIIRVIDPTGKVLFDVADGGGFFVLNEKESPYTLKESILFDNSNQTVTFEYKKGSEYPSGTYKVEIYGDGYMIGQSSFIVK
jgi:cytoskeletal protein RodZ